MPHVESLVPKKHAFGILFGQKPLTHFRDYRKAIKVDLIKWDDPEAMIDGTYDFVKATWSLDGRESERATYEEKVEAMNQMLAGKALGLGLETVNFMFRISGISRIDTHQIVRQRIGVTFSQQCSGDQFWHHYNCLVEPSIYFSGLDNWALFRDSTLKCKEAYVDMIDSQKVSIQAARSILPHNLETFIFMNTNLLTLLFFHHKRIDDGSQTWQINSIAQQMQDQVCEKFPLLFDVFEKNKKKFKLQKEASADRSNMFSTSLYPPLVDEFDYNNRDFLYPQTKREMHKLDYPGAVPDIYFWGWNEISKSKYDYIKKLYSELTNDIHHSPNLTNKQIFEKARRVEATIEAELSLYD